MSADETEVAGFFAGHPLGAQVYDAVATLVALARPDASPRWKQVVQVTAGRWMHHPEVGDSDDVDDELAGWVAEAYDLAG